MVKIDSGAQGRAVMFDIEDVKWNMTIGYGIAYSYTRRKRSHYHFTRFTSIRRLVINLVK